MPVSEIDEILINLKVLESLEINKKLVTRDTYLNVETDKIIPVGIRRWWRQDDRNETLRKIDDIVDKALRLRDDKDKRFIEEDGTIEIEKLVFLKSIANVIKTGMNILGVDTPQKM